jgi:hypothetical protein
MIQIASSLDNKVKNKNTQNIKGFLFEKDNDKIIK